MSTPAPAPAATTPEPSPKEPSGGLDRYFKISQRGSTVAREVRGGFATFFAMAYIIVLNPIILGSAKDMYGHQLDMRPAGHGHRADGRLHHPPHGCHRQCPDRARHAASA